MGAAGVAWGAMGIGSRGSGKSALVNQILREQRSVNPDSFHIVRLNGFIHTDDKIALREIILEAILRPCRICTPSCGYGLESRVRPSTAGHIPPSNTRPSFVFF